MITFWSNVNGMQAKEDFTCRLPYYLAALLSSSRSNARLFLLLVVHCETMGLVGTVVDTAIGWMVETILGSFLPPQMQEWTQQAGLAEDVAMLESEMKSVHILVAAAQGRRIDSSPLSDSLHELKELLYDAEDVMDELDYYRLQHHIKGDATRPH
ncbi:hypothetical protein GUJ93_ZPchr0002g23079 [Zizania palustris]|uniref:Disease resistance N-terminal domain-containing protein n=1 Tax=Zizania palustris TaxID=103762 RepID=A0A8J5VAL4_ZIZPA|nr:hypothetical protein GUJ93_ZPchr0002g23079 [Zizania palustris]